MEPNCARTSLRQSPASDRSPDHRLSVSGGFWCLLVLLSTVVGIASADDPSEYTNAGRNETFLRLQNSADPVQQSLMRQPGWQMVGATEDGRPVFIADHNSVSAETIRSNELWPGGSSGFDANGSSAIFGVIGIFENGRVLATHDELAGRVSDVHDPATEVSNHATHVTGTILASGVESLVRGMSYAANATVYPTIDVSSGCDDHCVMAGPAAAGMLVSNHSYGHVLGWSSVYDEDTDVTEWYWFGPSGSSSDPAFGAYVELSESWDQLAWTEQSYTIVKSAGNDRNDAGPAEGEGHYHFDTVLEVWVWDTDYHQPDGNWDTLGARGVAKNSITVGAVEDIPGGWTSASDVVLAEFSSTGPTDDGRIKPDLVANGVDLYSCTADATDAYGSLSGTSMSAPSVTGSINLLREIYNTLHGVTPRASTLKAITIHTADEAGNTGPDYTFGWGLMNSRAAADLIQAHEPASPQIFEGTVDEHGPDYELEQYLLSHSGGSFRATLVWTDLPADPDDTAPDLMHDLDLRLTDASGFSVYFPWVMDLTDPSADATSGDNTVDNVEQIWVESLPAGDYSLTITHKGLLPTSVAQSYSLVVSESAAGFATGLVVEILPGMGGVSVPTSVTASLNGIFVGGHITAEDDWQAPASWRRVNGFWDPVILPSLGEGDATVADLISGGADTLHLVGRAFDAGGTGHAVLWQVTGQTTLEVLPAASLFGAKAVAVAQEGPGLAIVGWAIAPDGTPKAYRWYRDPTTLEYISESLPDEGQGLASVATDVVVTPGGLRICGSVESLDGSQPTLWVEAGNSYDRETLELPNGYDRGAVTSILEGPAANPKMAGWAEDEAGNRIGVLWQLGQTTVLQPALPGDVSAQTVAGAREDGEILLMGNSYDSEGVGSATYWFRAGQQGYVPVALTDLATAEEPMQLRSVTDCTLVSYPWSQSWDMAAVGTAELTSSGATGSSSVGYVVTSHIAPSSTPGGETADTQLHLSVGSNPIRSHSRIELQLSEAGQVRVELFDAGGRRLAQLVNDWMPAGTHELELPGLGGLPAGVLFLRASTGEAETALKLVHLR